MKVKFKNLEPEDTEFIKLIYDSERSHNEKIEILTKKYGVKGRTIRNWWQKLDLSGSGMFRLPRQLALARDKVLDKDTDVVLVTSCQNKTLVNEFFFKNLKAYAKFIEEKLKLKVQIVVIPSRYRNPTSPTETSKKRADEWWVEDVEPYLYYSKLEFGDTLISADSRVRPTASMPLNGYESLAFDRHLVLGHSRIHYKTLPRVLGDDLRVMCTTGFISNKNYSSSKAGDKAFIHHSYGFVVVEKDKNDRCLLPRNVKVNADGSFTDIVFEVNEGKVSTIKSSKALVWGDIHHANIDPIFEKHSYKLAELLRPEVQVLHDLFDGESVNPHEKKNMFLQKMKIREGRNIIKKEVDNSLQFVNSLGKMFPKSEIYITHSNHDNFLDRHINDESWKRDLHNSETYLEYALIQQKVDLREHGNIFGYLVNSDEDIRGNYIPANRSFRVDGYQVGLHGDNGVNGARGSVNSFKKFNTKMIHGHSHSPTIIDGITCVGVTSKLWQYYNSAGLSSWAHAHSVIHNTGKNQLLVFDDDYRLSLLI